MVMFHVRQHTVQRLGKAHSLCLLHAQLQAIVGLGLGLVQWIGMPGRLQIGVISTVMAHMVLMDGAGLQVQTASQGRIPTHPMLGRVDRNLSQTAGRCLQITRYGCHAIVGTW